MRNNLRRSRYGNGRNGRNKASTKQKTGKVYYKKSKEINPIRQQLESNGPLGKVRGNAQQIYDKYKNAGHEALSAGDKYRAEMLFQYAEHYMVLMCDYREKYPETKMVVNVENDASFDTENDTENAENAETGDIVPFAKSESSAKADIDIVPQETESDAA